MSAETEDWFSRLTYVALGIALTVCVWTVFYFLGPIINPDMAGLWQSAVDWAKWATVTNAAAAAAMVVLTVLLVRFTRQQADATQKSVRAMRQSTRVAMKTLDHARKAANETYELHRKAQRAWVLPEPYLFPNKQVDFRLTEHWRTPAQLSFMNIGQLPAFGARVTTRVLREGGDSPEIEGEPDPAIGRAHFRRDQSHNFLLQIAAGSREEIQCIADGTQVLSVRVEITYTDPIGTDGLTAFTMNYEPIDVDRGLFLFSRDGAVIR